MDPVFDDPYVKSRLPYSLDQVEFQFDTAALLPSPYKIDSGTQLLLSYLAEKAGTARTILEIGCNYGVVGIVLAKLNPQSEVTMVDKDMLAVRYARHNAALNKVLNVTVAGSIGVENIAQQSFDLIVATIPTKIGDKAIEYDLVARPLELLARGGYYWFVTESQLNRLIPGVARRHKLALSEVDRQEGHILFSIRKP
jgi:16S rRNA (guanine1207-N2)-methyltransferase